MIQRKFLKNSHDLVLILRMMTLAILGIVFLSGCQPSWKIENPYSTVDWKNHGQYKANLHTHTMVSDGWMNPHTVVEKYREKGYQILAISDHNAVTYPWEEFSGFKAGGSIFKRIEEKKLKPQEEEMILPEDLEFKNVNPSDVGMLAIQANELSSHHHTGSYFNDHNGTKTEIESLEAVAGKGGLNVLFHPGRYHGTNPEHYSFQWYLNLYETYDHLIGIEVFNNGMRYPRDRSLWDSILTVMAPVRPVWGFSNDDMHSMRDFGRNWNVFLLPELDVQQVRHAMENGIFFFVYAPEGQDGPAPPVIRKIKVNQRRGKIEIEASGQDSIVWISGGERLTRGNEFSFRKVQKEINYVRAEVHGKEFSVVCTQPFIIKKTDPSCFPSCPLK